MNQPRRYLIPKEDAADWAYAMSAPCPRCKAAIGESCVIISVGGQPTDMTRDYPHPERYDHAAEIRDECGYCHVPLALHGVGPCPEELRVAAIIDAEEKSDRTRSKKRRERLRAKANGND